MRLISTNVVFVGGAYGKGFLESTMPLANARLQMAADRFQKCFIDGLARRQGVKLSVVTSPFVGSYPFNYGAPFIQGFVEEIGPAAHIRSVRTINLPIVKLFSKFISLLKEMKVVQRLNGTPDLIFVYSINLPYLAAAVIGRMLFGGKTLIPIITDLPIFPGDSLLLYRIYLKYIEWPLVCLLIRRCDRFIVLTKYMPAKLGLNESCCIVIEGIWTSQRARPLASMSGRTPRNIVYTGTLDSRYGVKELVDQFLLLDRSYYMLTLYGDGPLRAYLQSLPAESSVRYGGILDPDEVAAVQCNADLLINPRTNEGEYNKYSFPSKLIEYLASGVPVLCFRLDGVPQKYYDFLHVVNDDGCENLAGAVQRVLSIDRSELLERADRGREFIASSKSADVQIARVMKFVGRLD